MSIVLQCIVKCVRTKIEHALNTIVSSRAICVSYVNRHVVLLLCCVKLFETTVALIPPPSIYLWKAMSPYLTALSRNNARSLWTHDSDERQWLSARTNFSEMYPGEDFATWSFPVAWTWRRTCRALQTRSFDSREIQVACGANFPRVHLLLFPLDGIFHRRTCVHLAFSACVRQKTSHFATRVLTHSIVSRL